MDVKCTIIGSRSASAFALPFRRAGVDLDGSLLGRVVSSVFSQLTSGFLPAAFFGGGGTGKEGGVGTFVDVAVVFALVARVVGAGGVFVAVLVRAELLVAILGFSDMSL